MKFRLRLQLLQYCYFIVLWIQGLFLVLLVHGRGKLGVMPVVTAVQLHHSAMYIGTEFCVVSSG